MPVHLQREIERLKKQTLALSASVEENLRRAVRSIMTCDRALADEVIRTDQEIDHTEVDVEEECLKILALHQPVAIDLRYIVAILKIDHDLERISDLAVNIAERAREVSPLIGDTMPFDLPDLAHRVQTMLSQSLEALIDLNPQLARKVWMSDDEVDVINRQTYNNVKAAMGRRPELIDDLLSMLTVSRNLERIADHAANIAKDVIYLVEGEIVRHRRKELGLQPEAG